MFKIVLFVFFYIIIVLYLPYLLLFMCFFIFFSLKEIILNAIIYLWRFRNLFVLRGVFYYSVKGYFLLITRLAISDCCSRGYSLFTIFVWHYI